MKQLLEVGVHFGHQTKKWNPKMKKYIYAAKNGIYIIDLTETLRLLLEAYEYVKKISADGGTILFVGITICRYLLYILICYQKQSQGFWKHMSM